MVNIEEVLANLLCRLEFPRIIVNVMVDVVGAARNLVEVVALLELDFVGMQKVLCLEITESDTLISMGLVF